MEKKELINYAERILDNFELQKQEQIQFLKTALKKTNRILDFTEFDKEFGEIDKSHFEDVEEVIECAPYITHYFFNESSDYHLIGLEYIENENNVRRPWDIIIYAIHDDAINCVETFYLDDMDSTQYITLVEYVKEHLENM